MAVKFKTKAERDGFLRKLREPARYVRVERQPDQPERPAEASTNERSESGAHG